MNFATEKAIVTAPPSVAVEQLIEAVEQAGYDAELTTAAPRLGDRAGEPRTALLPMPSGSPTCGAG